MTPSRRRSRVQSAPGAREWVGGRLSCPFYVTGADPPYRPEMMLWVELPGELIVAGKILGRNPPAQPLVEALRDAFRRPLAGPPRRPARIRVATEADAAEVRAFVGPSIPVLVAPAPELPAVMDEMLEMMPEEAGGAVEPSYFEEGRISPDLVARLFAAGRVLYAAAPWKQAHDQQTLRMDIPALGVEGACVSIIGALGETLGVLVFPSQTALDAYLEVAAAGLEGEWPVDLGTTLLSLTFEKADELPDPMRREALRHGWPVAGPDAYPRVEHRDRDGVLRPLTERDVRIATACASAVAAFTATQGHVFSAQRFEPVSVTFTGDDEVGVRLTAPYDAAGLFERDGQLALAFEPGVEPVRPAVSAEGTVTGAPAGAGAAGRPRPSRNAPCWCGSGKKYKRCHLDADLAADRARVAEPAPIHTADERLVQRMARFAIARFGERWLKEAARPFADLVAASQLFQPWSVYHQPADGRPVVDWFLAEEGGRLSREERSWLEAQRVSWLGLWEVLAVTPGRGMAVRDLLTGIERDVVEVSGSRTLVARDTVLGRVVDHGGLSVFAGVHPRPLPPLDAAEVVDAVRRRVRRRRAIPPERLREPVLERYLISRWEEVVAAMDARHRAPPALRNTDGDELLFTTDHFAFDPAARGKVEAALASVEQLESTERGQGERRYTFTRPESAVPSAAAAVLPGGTILGQVRLGASELTLETNSLARADRLRRRLEAACGGLLAHRAREHTSPGALMQSAPEVGDRRREPQEPPPEVQRALADWMERYYAAWLDRPVPALGGMTPRQASRTRAGREALDLLLKDMENRAARGPGNGQPDVAGLRAKLGMEE